MTEHIYEIAKSLYDDWKEKSYTLTPDDVSKYSSQRLDSIRLTLEPHIYHYLIEKYSSKLNTFWDTYRPPKEAKYAFAIIERRIHPNYWFILRNIAWAGPNMSVYLFCSDKNIDYIRSLLGDKAPYFNLIQAFQGNPSRDRGKKEVDNLLSDYRTYESIKAEYILTIEMDTFIRKKIPDTLFKGTYWGCLWPWSQNSPGGGGLTVRNIKQCVELCKKNRDLSKDLHISQDCWLAGLSENLADLPPIESRIQYLMESYPTKDPVGVHQFWTFIDSFNIVDKNTYMAYLNTILSFDI